MTNWTYQNIHSPGGTSDTLEVNIDQHVHEITGQHGIHYRIILRKPLPGKKVTRSHSLEITMKRALDTHPALIRMQFNPREKTWESPSVSVGMGATDPMRVFRVLKTIRDTIATDTSPHPSPGDLDEVKQLIQNELHVKRGWSYSSDQTASSTSVTHKLETDDHVLEYTEFKPVGSMTGQLEQTHLTLMDKNTNTLYSITRKPNTKGKFLTRRTVTLQSGTCETMKASHKKIAKDVIKELFSNAPHPGAQTRPAIEGFVRKHL